MIKTLKAKFWPLGSKNGGAQNGILSKERLQERFCAACRSCEWGEVMVVVANHANAKQAGNTHRKVQRRAEGYLQTAESQRCFHPMFLRLDCHNLCLWCGGVKRSYTLLLFLCSFLLRWWVSEKTRAKGSLSVPPPEGKGNVILSTPDYTPLLIS